MPAFVTKRLHLGESDDNRMNARRPRLSPGSEGVKELPYPLIPADTGIQPLPTDGSVHFGKVWIPADERVKEMGLQPGSFSQPDMARTSGHFQAEPGIPALMAQRITSSAVCRPTRERTDQAALVRNRCAAIRLLASACHNATAWPLIRPRTGMKPNP